MEKVKDNNVAILVCTYDGAKDLWEPLNKTYKKYWPDCPYNIYLSTNYEQPNLEPFIPLQIGTETSWSDNIIKCLNGIQEDYVMLTFDDLFLFKKIETNNINHLFNLAINNEWEYLRLHPSPLPDEKISKIIGKIKPNRLYRTSTVLALFKKEVLIDLLVESENAWEFERNGSIRSNKYQHFYSVTKTVFPYLNGVVKGKWIPEVLEYLKNDGIEISENHRKIMSPLESKQEKIKKLRLKLFFKLVPASARLTLRKLFTW